MSATARPKSFPRKNDVGRIYRDTNGSYLIVFPGNSGPGGMEAIANVLNGPDPSPGTCSISPNYIAAKWLKRVAWNELPRRWRGALRRWLVDDPKDIPGFWRLA